MNFCPHCAARLEVRPVDGRPRPVCAACERVFYLDPKVAACAIPEQDGRIVLVRRSIQPSYGKWVFPGGYLDRGETVEEAARRETREETGLEVRLGGLLNVYSYPDSIVVIIVYRAEITGGELRPGAECLDARLFAPAEIPWNELAFRSTVAALRDWIGGVAGAGVDESSSR